MNIQAIIRVESSNVYGISYDLHSQTLFVQFNAKGGGPGSIYRYIAVPPEVYQRFMDSPTKGGFFAKNVKGVYSSEKLT